MLISSPESVVPLDQIQTQLKRILASKLFSRSQRQSAFLAHIVNAACENQSHKLKEFTLGVEVFDKDESFDPGTDSIVRVEASRLRAKLREYYLEQGIDDPIKIEVPKGHYGPVFYHVAGDETTQRGVSDSAPSVVPKAFQLLLGGISTAILAGILFLVYESFQKRSTPAALIPAGSVPIASTAWSSRIAVMPLQDLSEPAELHFGEAMTDGLISVLSAADDLRVTSLTSVLKYKNTNVPIASIGRSLGVDHIVDGSLYREDERVRVTAQLFDLKAGEAIWSNTFDRPIESLASLHQEIGAAISALISNAEPPSEHSPKKEPNPAAYEAYMKGRYFFNRFTASGYRRSMEYFQEAIEIEPNYAEAYAGLASCHCLLAGHGLEMVSPDVAIPQAQALAWKAQAQSPLLAEPYAFLGIIDFKFGWDLNGAIKKIKQAIELNPSLYQAYVWDSQILEAMGRHDDAVIRAREAKQLNPLSLAASLNLGWQMYQAGNYIEANTEIDRLIEFSPGFWGGYWVKGNIYNQHRIYEKAVREFEKAVELRGGHSLPLSALGYTYGVAGRHEDARKIIAQLEEFSKDSYVSPFHIALIYAGLNDIDKMFELLEDAYQVRARSLAWLQVSHELKPYHDDPRFQDLLERIGMFQIPMTNVKTL